MSNSSTGFTRTTTTTTTDQSTLTTEACGGNGNGGAASNSPSSPSDHNLFFHPSNSEQLCYVHCTFCDTVLAVSVPCSSLFKTVIVRCGHCSTLLSVNMRALLLPAPPATPPVNHPPFFTSPHNLLIDEVINQAQSTRSVLGSQRMMFGDIGGKVKVLSEKFPVIRGLLGSIKRKKSRDTLILSAVIAACTLFIIIYWLAK